MRRLLLICLSFLIVGSAWGQGKTKTRAWGQEPDSFLGVKFRQPFPSEIPDCFGGLVDKVSATDLCVDRGLPGLGFYTLYGLPSEVRFIRFPNVQISDGVVSNFSITTNIAEYRQLKGLFIERYGKPTSAKTRDMQNRMGAKFKSESLEWLGKRVRINLYEHADSIDTSMAFLSDLSMEDRKESSSTEAIKKAASKL